MKNLVVAISIFLGVFSLMFLVNFAEYAHLKCITRSHYIFVIFSLSTLAILITFAFILVAISLYKSKTKLNSNIMKTNVNTLSPLEAYVLRERVGYAPSEPVYAALIPLLAQLNEKSLVILFKGNFLFNELLLKSKDLEPYEKKALKILTSSNPFAIFSRSLNVNKTLIRKGFLKSRISISGFVICTKLTMKAKRNMIILEKKSDNPESMSSADPYYYSLPEIVSKEDSIYQMYKILVDGYMEETSERIFDGNSSVLEEKK